MASLDPETQFRRGFSATTAELYDKSPAFVCKFDAANFGPLLTCYRGNRVLPARLVRVAEDQNMVLDKLFGFPNFTRSKSSAATDSLSIATPEANKMTEYTTLRNTDLQKLLADRNLSVTGSKVTMIERLQDDDAAKKRSLPLRNPDGAAAGLRRSVHHENLDKRWFQPRRERPKEPSYFTHRDQIQRLASIKRAAKNSIPDEVVGVERHCLDEDCGGIGTCGACKWVKYEQKMKRAGTGAWRENRGPRRPKQRGLSYWPSLTSASDRGHDSIDRPRCGMIDAMMGPQMRNEDLRRRRASKILTGNPESYEGPASGVARKRRFSNLGLEYPLPSRHPLAQCIRDEEKREELERAHFWMGRPILSEKEISILKCLPSIPKYYLSESEDNDILLPKGAKEKRLCIVIRRLEAELMSRDFWMQSLGYNAADAFVV
ncbi:hypothetical protein D6C80_01090 [Aureobasidium pullulans]|nr:hypothetical protein D6C80_01090 [Aureobasidium pullulans]